MCIYNKNSKDIIGKLLQNRRNFTNNKVSKKSMPPATLSTKTLPNQTNDIKNSVSKNIIDPRTLAHLMVTDMEVILRSTC